jgi:hypothetical protein
MVGLVLGLLLRATGLSPEETLMEGVVAGGRSVLWFIAFGLSYSVPWSGSWLARVVGGGVAALLLNWTVSGGVSSPSVAQPLWVLAALGLNALPARASLPPTAGAGTWLELWTWKPKGGLGWVLPLPVLMGVWLVYVLLFFYPVSTCLENVNRARRHYASYALLRKASDEQAAKEVSSQPRDALLRASTYLRDFILRPLEQARQADPANSVPPLELAAWYGEQGKLHPRTEEFLQKALEYTSLAQKLDPESREGYLAEYRLQVQRAQQFPAQARPAYGLAANALAAVVERDPTEARWRYLLAEALFQAGDPVQGRVQAERARQADERATEPTRQLTGPQRDQVRQWLNLPS